MSASNRAVRLAEISLLTGATLLYLLTLDNGLQSYELRGGDLITHHYAQVQARFANAPGYPLYSMGGWLWFHAIDTLIAALGVQYPNPIPILSSYSTLWAIPALWLFFRLILRCTKSAVYPAGNWPIAWLISAFFAATYFFWYYATTSEQYSSAVAQTLAILLVYAVWSERVRQSQKAHALTVDGTGSTGARANRLLYLLAFLCGVSLAHMLTVAFIVPPLVAVVLHQTPHLLRSVRVVAGAVAAAALPLAAYLFVYVRGAQFPEWRGQGEWATTSEWFWSFVGTDQGREELGWGLAPDAPLFGNGFPELIWQELSLPLLIAGLIGIAWLPRRMATIIYVTLLIYLAFCWAYRLGNWFQVILPAYPLILLGSAALLNWLDLWLRAWSNAQPRRRWANIAVATALMVAFVWRVDASLPAANSRDRPEDTGLTRAARLLDDRLPYAAPVFASVDDVLALQYLTNIWRIRPDIAPVSSRDAAARLAAGAQIAATTDTVQLLIDEIRHHGAQTSQLAPDATIYLDTLSPDWIAVALADTAHSDGGQPDTPSAIEQTAIQYRVDSQLHDELTLTGFSIERPSGATERVTALADAARDDIDVVLYWNVPTNPREGLPFWNEDYRVSVRLRGAQGYLLAASHEGVDPEFAHDEPQYAMLDRAQPSPLHLFAATGNLPPSLAFTTRQTKEDGTAWVDPYRFSLKPDQLHNLDALQIILYRTTEQGFENLVDTSFELDPTHLLPR